MSFDITNVTQVVEKVETVCHTLSFEKRGLLSTYRESMLE